MKMTETIEYTNSKKIIKYGELLDSCQSSIRTTRKHFSHDTERIKRYITLRHWLVNRLSNQLK